MSYPIDLDEYTTAQLERELKERQDRHKAGKCSYCIRDHNQRPICKFPRRHSGADI